MLLGLYKLLEKFSKAGNERASISFIPSSVEPDCLVIESTIKIRGTKGYKYVTFQKSMTEIQLILLSRDPETMEVFIEDILYEIKEKVKKLSEIHSDNPLKVKDVRKPFKPRKLEHPELGE